MNIHRLTLRVLRAGLFASSVCGLGAQDALKVTPASSESGPVIFIPGFMGSRLDDARDGKRNGKREWGKLVLLPRRSALAIQFSPDEDGLALPIDHPEDFRLDRDRLVAAGIIDRYTLIPGLVHVNVYAGIVSALRKRCVHLPGDPAACTPDTSVYEFAYDWRRDNVENAQLLARRIAELQLASGNPAQKVTLIAHSMGGLIALYYLRYGDRDVLHDNPLPPPDFAGARHVRQVILIGVPRGGSLDALSTLQLGFRGFGRRINPDAAFTMPSLYQLLPPAGEPVFVDARLNPLAVDLYDPENWRRFGWGPFSRAFRKQFERNGRKVFSGVDFRARTDAEFGKFFPFLAAVLKRARAFQAAIASGPAESIPVPIRTFGNNTLLTKVRVILDATTGGPELDFDGRNHSGLARESIRHILYGPGDDTVSWDSLQHGTSYDAPYRVDGKHFQLPSQPPMLAFLREILDGGVTVEPGATVPAR